MTVLRLSKGPSPMEKEAGCEITARAWRQLVPGVQKNPQYKGSPRLRIHSRLWAIILIFQASPNLCPPHEEICGKRVKSDYSRPICGMTV